MEATLFDRCIDVTVYDKNREPIATILTPEYGPKPEITVEGIIISNTYQISGKVTITNLERSIAVEEAEYLQVEMYYGGAKKVKALRKTVLFKVTFADQSKAPPNRQVCFNCLVAGTTPDIMSYPVTIGKIDGEGNPEAQTFDSLLRDVIAAYNEAVANEVPSWTKELSLDSSPEYRLTPSTKETFESVHVSAQWVNTPISSILDSLMICSVSSEPITENATYRKDYYAFNFYIDNKHLVVAENPSNNNIAFTEQEQLELNYVLSAYRFGPIVHVRSLFDPRIHQDILLSINGTNISGRKAAGNLIPLLTYSSSGEVKFRPVGGIKYTFSTTGENWMQMQGVMDEGSLGA